MGARPRFSQVLTDHKPLRGGLDLVTPRIEMDGGRVFDAQNFEPLPVGGYRRIDGFERFDGRTTPTSAAYWVLGATVTGTVNVGDTVTGNTSGATGKVLSVTTDGVPVLVLGRVTGTFVAAEALKVAGVTQATSTTTAAQSGASTPLLDATFRLLAANDRRADILVVPGSGQIRGVFVLNDIVYVLRDNVGATASILYKATTGGWSAVSLGREMLVQARSGTCTISNAAPGVVTFAGHAFSANQPVAFTTTGGLPAPLVAGTTYYVLAPAANTFTVSATAGGAAITTTSAGSGTHTVTLVAATGFSVGDVVTGASSGATATVKASLLRTGTWAAGPAGSLVFATVTGLFTSGEALQVGGVTIGQANGADTAIARLPGGRVDVVIGNFTGSSTTRKAYGADGVNPGFEFDGTTYVPIHTGMAADTPTFVEIFRNKLVFAFASSVQLSTTNGPYAWTALTGAAELGVGDTITGLFVQTGTYSNASLAIFTKGRTFILYGSSAGDFQLMPSIFDIGFTAYTGQHVSNNTYGLTARGVQSLMTTLNYGDFSFDAVSFLVQPLVTRQYSLACAAVTLRGKNQYRLYFTDGTGLAFGLTGEQLSGILPLNTGKAVRCIWASVWSTGAERVFFGSDDGYLYEDCVGTSFDGGNIEYWFRPAFNNLGSPRVNKRYRRAVFEASCEGGYASVNIGYDLGYANPNVEPPATQPNQALAGAGMYWDAQNVYWDSFVWDAPVVSEPQISIDGADNNIGFVVYGNSAMDDPTVWQGVSLLYTNRHLTR